MLSRGKQAEDLARRWLRKQRVKILECNFYSRWGEIDIIALDNNTLSFIEVRHRQSKCFGTAAESVTRAKQQRIIKTAHFYLMQHKKLEQLAARFDILSISGDLDNPEVDWYKDAFMMMA